MARFNRNRYITDDSYEMPWRELHGNINIEGMVRGYLQILEDQGVVEWNENAILTDVPDPGYPPGDWMDNEVFERPWARNILVEGVGLDGEEIVFLKVLTKSGRSRSTLYIDGEPFSARKAAYSFKEDARDPKMTGIAFRGWFTDETVLKSKEWD